MKVKKPQSKRKSTKLQKGIAKKVAAHNRKQNKLAKKDVTWKSRTPKDPGIPNSYPYKAQLLEEIEEQKQRDTEARIARREELRAQAISRGATEQDLANIEAEQDVAENQNRLGALMDSVRQATATFEGGDNEDDDMGSDDSMDDEEVEEDPELIAAFEEIRQDTSRKAFDKHFKQVLDTCDVIIYVLDARNPNGTRSKHVEETVLAHPNKRLILALNKIDLVPEETLKGWLKYLQRYFPTVPLAASAPAANAHTFDHAKLNKASTSAKLLEALKKFAADSQLKRSITAGVIGYPNVGKSSVINALLNRHGGHHRACPVGAQAGVTTDVRRVKVDNKLSILDSPGIVFPTKEKQSAANPVQEHARLVLLNAVPPKYLGDCRPAVTTLLKRLQKQPEQLELFMKHYDVPPVPQGGDFNEYITHLLVQVGRAMGRLGRGGVPDLGSAAQAIITDWRDGRVSGWAPAPSDPPKSTNVEVVTTWAKEFDLDSILDGLL